MILFKFLTSILAYVSDRYDGYDEKVTYNTCETFHYLFKCVVQLKMFTLVKWNGK